MDVSNRMYCYAFNLVVLYWTQVYAIASTQLVCGEGASVGYDYEIKIVTSGTIANGIHCFKDNQTLGGCNADGHSCTNNVTGYEINGHDGDYTLQIESVLVSDLGSLFTCLDQMALSPSTEVSKCVLEECKHPWNITCLSFTGVYSILAIVWILVHTLKDRKACYFWLDFQCGMAFLFLLATSIAHVCIFYDLARWGRKCDSIGQGFSIFFVVTGFICAFASLALAIKRGMIRRSSCGKNLNTCGKK